jgi:hypothetical protein
MVGPLYEFLFLGETFQRGGMSYERNSVFISTSYIFLIPLTTNAIACAIPLTNYLSTINTTSDVISG